jgi:glucose/arabinose dehydrogenase
VTTRARVVRGVIVAAVVIVIAAVAVVLKNRSDEVGTHRGEPPVQTSTTPPTDPTLTAPPSSSSDAAPPDAAPALIPVATVESPVAFAVRAGDTSLYVNEQVGRVRRIVVNGATYALDDAPFLDIASDVNAGGERGLLGITFAPSGDRMYVTFTNKEGNQQLDELTLAGGVPDLSTRRTLLVVPDFASNHNGGQLAFGPDGFLYWSMGDGGGAGDPQSNGQKTTDLLGDILRLDVSKAEDGKPYAIPPDNPFADGRDGAPEVFAYGLRNPWRFSFDRSTGDLWIADVGQGDIEEIDFAPAGKGAGMNFGWSALEGTHPFNSSSNPDGATLPVYEYDHASTGGCSVTGGFVYRGDELRRLDGSYLFGDYCAGQLMALRRSADGSVTVTDLGLNVPRLSSFGEAADGSVYVLSTAGDVFRLGAA